MYMLKADFQKAASSKNGDGKVFRILTVGRLHPRKGQDRLITALRHLPKELKSGLELGIVGSGNKRGFGDRLRALAESSEFRIMFYGDVTNDRLRELYAQSDLFAMTSIPYRNCIEGFGLVYLEAADNVNNLIFVFDWADPPIVDDELELTIPLLLLLVFAIAAEGFTHNGD